MYPDKRGVGNPFLSNTPQQFDARGQTAGERAWLDLYRSVRSKERRVLLTDYLGIISGGHHVFLPSNSPDKHCRFDKEISVWVGRAAQGAPRSPPECPVAILLSHTCPFPACSSLMVEFGTAGKLDDNFLGRG